MIESPEQRCIPDSIVLGATQKCCVGTLADQMVYQNTAPAVESMAACAGPSAPRNCKSRQARKGAAVATDAGAGVRLVQVAATCSFPPDINIGIVSTACLPISRATTERNLGQRFSGSLLK